MITFERYLNEHRHSRQTIKSYLYTVSVFLNANPNAPNFKYKDIIDYMNKVGKQYPNTYTANSILAGIKKYYDYLIEIGKRDFHPCRTLYLKCKRGKDIIHQDLFTSEDLERLLTRKERYKNIKLKNQTIMSLLVFQGLTTGEIMALRVQHVNLDNGIIYIKGSRQQSSRHLEIHPRQFTLLYRCVNEMERVDTDALLIGRSGKPITVDDVHHIVHTCKPFFPDRKLDTKTIR
ncbi:MAG TPA: tyrosine-type recombinase/integrase, partial [Bacteroidia bacterium]|nr:tyrosine-type recombinase/integrase [Bacteroidia bacterium]